MLLSVALALPSPINAHHIKNPHINLSIYIHVCTVCVQTYRYMYIGENSQNVNIKFEYMVTNLHSEKASLQSKVCWQL